MIGPSPARTEFEAAAEAERNATSYALGAQAMWDALAVDATTVGLTLTPTSRVARTYADALANRAHAGARSARAGEALHRETQARARAAREQREAPAVTPALEQLHAAALDKDAPGAWIRDAIERQTAEAPE